MPTSDRLVSVALTAPSLALGIGLLATAGCGPPELGSIKLPAELSRGAKPGHGPDAAMEGRSPLGPGQFRVAPKTTQARRRRG